MHRVKQALPLLLLFIVLGVAMTACSTGGVNKPSIKSQAQQAVQDRANTYAKASAQYPTPTLTNFPRRKTLVDSTIRQSLPNHPWYVYVLGMNGNIVNYYVAKSVPVNDCDYLSSTDAVQYYHGGDFAFDMPAPSLEGIYQSSSGCNTLTFFDLTTDAEIQVTGLNTYVTDRPLKVAAQPIKVKRG